MAQMCIMMILPTYLSHRHELTIETITLHTEIVSAAPLEAGPSSALGPDCKALKVIAESPSDTSEVGAV